MIIIGGLAAAGALSAFANLINGSRTRKMQREFHDADQTTAERRFQSQHNLQNNQFIFTQEEAERNRAERIHGLALRQQERAEDREFTLNRDDMARSSAALSHVFHGSVRSWLHDPHAASGSNVKSLHVFFQRPKGYQEEFHTDIERKISQALRQYDQTGGDYPVCFPTGMWKDGPQSQSGSWLAHDMYAIDRDTPTLIFRLEKSGNDFMVQADMFGFRLGQRSFFENIDLGAVPKNDIHAIGTVLPLLTLATADAYFAYGYGKKPLLPELLPQMLPAGDQSLAHASGEIVNSYRQIVNGLVVENPELGIYAALNLAESLIALPDKRFALEETMEIEEMMKSRIAHLPALQDALIHLYASLGEDARAQSIKDYKKSPSTEKLTFEALRRL